MVVHMIRVLCEPPKGEADNAVQNWVDNYKEWENDPTEHSLTETNTEMDGSGINYCCGDWRFIQEGKDPTNILEDLSGRLQKIQNGLWHRLLYHVCSHDEEERENCTWNEKVEWGSIPEEIPDPM